MSNQAVNVDFVVNGGQYGASLQQMIAVTQQYNQVVDTTLGKVAKVGGMATTYFVNAAGKLTQANKTATAQAAAYQQKMSSLEATAKVMGDKTFPKLEKATLKLAREFPIGMGQAVEQMESLQKTGVTAVDQMEKLAKAYTRLGAATGEYGPALGQQMTELTRTMGNNLSSVDGYSDSLTTLTARFGGTASSVLAFSKSIAPVADVVGMNQAQVMGLSTAFARLGEDGFAAGNAMNKVLIDLNRAVRDGGPELRTYANVLNTTVEDLRRQMQTDPTSVLVDFTESINQAGPDAIRTLEMLGLEGVRTTKAITALSREGNLGEIISEAGKAYGSGSTATAAETALSGVNDQMQRLNESSQQMIMQAGKPFLDWMESVLSIANRITEAFNQIIASPFMQGIGKVGAVLEAGAGAAMTGFQIAAAGALVNRGRRAIGRSREQWLAGRTAEALGQSVEDIGPTGFWAGAGQRYQRSPMADRSGPAFGSGVRRTVRGAGVGGWNAAILGMNFLANDIRTGFGRDARTSPNGQAGMAAASALRADISSGNATRGLAQFNREMSRIGSEATKSTRAFGTMRSAMLNMATAVPYGVARTGAMAGGMAWRGATALGSMFGLGPVGVGVAAAGGAAYLGYKAYQNEQKVGESIESGLSDPYRAFNDFAVKAGLATESITLLGAAAEDAAKTLAGGNRTIQEALDVTAAEMNVLSAPGYEAAFTSSGRGSTDALMAFMQNATMSPEALGRITNDVASQVTKTELTAFQETWKQLSQGPMSDVVAAGLAEAEQRQGWFGRDTDESRAVVEQTVGYLQQRWSKQGEMFGSEYGNRMKAQDLEELFGGALSKSGEERDWTTRIISEALGMDQAAIERAYVGGAPGTSNEELFGNLLEVAAGRNADSKAMYDAWSKTEDQLKVEESAVVASSRQMTRSLQELTGTALDMTDIMYAGNEIAKDSGKSINELTAQQLSGLTATQRAVVESKQQPSDPQALIQAGSAVVSEAFKQSGGDLAVVTAALVGDLASGDDATKNIAEQALAMMATNPDVMRAMTGMSTNQRRQQQMRTAQTVLQQGLPPSSDPRAIGEYMQAQSDWASGYQQTAQQAMQLADMVRSAEIQMTRVAEDQSRARARSQQDFNRQMRWGQEDYQHQRRLSHRQFNIAQERQEDAYYLSRRRARRDFNISMQRNEESFQRSTLRQQIQFDKSLERQAEDNAKALYDPYQRVQHRRTWDMANLAGNLRDQNEMIARQFAAVDQMKQMGVSQSAIDLLGLNDPQNASQAIKALADMMQSPDMIRQINEAVAGRLDLSAAFTVDEDNVGYRRQLEDYEQSMAWAREDFAISMSQAREDFNRQLSDGAADFKRQKKYQMEDFDLQMKEMARQFRVGRRRAQTQQATMLSRMATDAAIARDRVFQDLKKAFDDYDKDVADRMEDAIAWVEKLPAKYRKPMLAALGELQDDLDKNPLTSTVNVLVKWKTTYAGGWEQYAKEHGIPTGSGGAGPIKVDMDDLGIASDVSGNGPTGQGRDGWSGRWRYYSDGKSFHGGADLGHKGDPVYSVTSGRVVTAKTLAGRQDPNGSYGKYVVVTDGSKDFLYAHMADYRVQSGDMVRAGQRIGTVGNTGNTLPLGSGHHLHFEVRPRRGSHGQAMDPSPWLAEGGIATRQMTPTIGEGGYPEAVIPLNARGAQFMGDLMMRYIGNHEAKKTAVGGYTTTIVNNVSTTQDYSTTFSGPVSVTANDPNEFAEAMRAKQRLARLVQPIGAK